MLAFNRRLGRTALISLVLAAAFALASAVPAAAADFTVVCDELQDALDDAQGNDEADVITLTETCEDRSFNIPAATTADTTTLQGNGPLSGFDGGDDDPIQRILTGDDIGNFVIQNLFFNDGNYGGSGGAIKVKGQFALTIQGSSFNENQAGNTGGAVYLRLDENMSDFTEPLGTGAAINGFPDISLHDNEFSENEAARSGGALHVETNDESLLNLSSNRFLANEVSTDSNEPPGPDHFGGGAFIESNNQVVQSERQDAATNTTLTQSNNLFDGNRIAQIDDDDSYFGGGEWISGVDTSSVNDQFINNELAGQFGLLGSEIIVPLPEGESEGGGLGFESANEVSSTLDGKNFVSAGNTIEGVGNGGGVYIGADGGETTFNLLQGTVSGNTINNSQGQNPGIGGSGDDNLHLENSIVNLNNLGEEPAQPDIGGFDTDNTLTVTYTDSCARPGVAYDGEGNICADPKLEDPLNGLVHQTVGQSPTIDKGNDGLLAGLQTDYEGGPRSTDGDGDGHTVDMGADETPGAAVAGGAAPVTLAGPVAPAAVPDCGRRDISLVRADVRGRRVVLNGLVSARLAGQTVAIFANYTRRRLGTVRSNAAGQFTVRVRRPSRKVFNKTLYQARVGAIRSIRLKLPQSLASRSITAQGNQITLRGRVKRSVLGRRNTVVIKRLICGRYRTVGRARPNRQGNYVARFSVPAGLTSALFRAESRVLRRRGSRVYVKQYGRAISITLTGRTG